MKNGNNKEITNFNAIDNLNLLCMEVDDAKWRIANRIKVDPHIDFSEDCGYK